MAAYPPRTRRRANGEGSLYRDSAGRWRGAVTWTDNAGQLKRRTVSAATQAEARGRLNVLRAELARGQEPSANVTLAEYLSRWLVAERARVAPKTWIGREQHIRGHIVPALGRVTLAKLTPADVERMTAGLIAAGKAARTAASVRVTLRKALGDAARDELVHRNVAALARPPRVPGRDMQPGRDYLEPAQLRALLTSCADNPLGPLVTVAATTGLRQGELLGLAWDSVDLDAALLTVRRSLARDWIGWKLAEPKTARSRRTLHLPARAVEALRAQQTAQDGLRAAAGTAWQDQHGLVFTDAVGRPLKASDVSHALDPLLTAAGLPHVPFHGLRHSTATALLAAGVPLRVVADQLGHSTITITADIYAAVVPDLRRDAADAMDRALGG